MEVAAIARELPLKSESRPGRNPDGISEGLVMSSPISYAKTPPESTEPPASTIARDTEIDARSYSPDAEMAYIATLEVNLNDPNPPSWYDETARYADQVRLQVLKADLDRKIRILSIPADRAPKISQDFEAWASLAKTVKEYVSVPELLSLIGCHVRQTGAHEFHSDCPVCRAGDDRLVIWQNRCWCRKCDWSADAIVIAQSFLPDATHFRDAVRILSNLAALNTAVR